MSKTLVVAALFIVHSVALLVAWIIMYCKMVPEKC